MCKLVCIVLVVAIASSCAPTATPTPTRPPPTATAVPTAVPPTAVPPTAVPPTAVPPTALPMPTPTQVRPSGTFQLTSTAFAYGKPIPVQFTCDGASTSPPLAWTAPPAGTMSFALICDDPDAPREGGFNHWVLYNQPAGSRSLPEAVATTLDLASDARQGLNGAGRPGYTGPCPPSGSHRYFFYLYALDSILRLTGDVTSTSLRAAIQGHILGTAELMGTYQRP